MNYTLNIRGRLMELGMPRVMGILNVTPDSFFAGSRVQTEHDVRQRARQIVDEGADIIDVGACSTRPDSAAVSEAEEMSRLRMALSAIRSEVPEAVVSVDTFRADVARMAVEEYGADIINDVGGTATLSPDNGGCPSESMLRAVSSLGVPYVLTSQKPTMRDTLLFFAEKVQALREMGQKDIIVDPGFGFGKTLEQNYEILSCLEQLQILELPVLVGVSRKSMITRLLGVDAEHALNGTTALHAVALMKGAAILRVHDVREAVECVKLTRICFSTLE